MHPDLILDNRISDLEALEQLFGKPVHTARQESDHIHAEFRAFIEEAPFIILASIGTDGLDASAKGDAGGGFVRVIDEKTLLIPSGGDRAERQLAQHHYPSAGSPDLFHSRPGICCASAARPL